MSTSVAAREFLTNFSPEHRQTHKAFLVLGWFIIFAGKKSLQLQATFIILIEIT